jgi:hypothetical protein
MWSRVLTVQVQNGQPYIWAMVDPTQPPVDFPFVVVGTGHETDIETEKYIGTIQLSDMNLVFHYFRG